MSVYNVRSADPEAHLAHSSRSSDSGIDSYAGRTLSDIERDIHREEEEVRLLDEQLADFKQEVLAMSEDKFQQLLADAKEIPEDEQGLSSKSNEDVIDFIMQLRQAPVRKKLFTAIKDRNVSRVRELLEEHPEAVHFRECKKINLKCRKDNPLLRITHRYLPHERIVEHSEDIEIAKMLLNKGADIDTQSEDGETSLMRAARLGQMNLVRFFLENGANKFLEDSDGKTAVKKAKFDAIAKYIEGYDIGLTKGATASK
jgi:hypothetical protein